MVVVTIIPARGGSKGIPKKNIKPMNGKPMIAWTIEASIKSGVDKTYVSTDSSEIAEVSRKYGAEVIVRSKDLAGDFTSSEDVLIHAVEYLEKEGVKPELIVFLQCTSPTREADVISSAVKKIDEGYDSVVAVFETTRYYGKSDRGVFKSFRGSIKRRQDTEKWYCDSGSCYVMKTDVFMKEKDRFCGKVGWVEMPEMDGFEVDNLFDFWLIERILEYKDFQ
ncbi:MAG: acylneuraminate cytidylyltransferase family protein [Nanoarchaeota archaeon]|nr:acylneuraminate cytidylyltransferase family protein [Nanoarchaeota archaeon]